MPFTAAIAASRSMGSPADSGTVATTGTGVKGEAVLALGPEAGAEGFGLNAGMGAVARGWRCFRCCILLSTAVKHATYSS